VSPLIGSSLSSSDESKPLLSFVDAETELTERRGAKGATKASDKWLCKQIASTKLIHSDNVIDLNDILRSQKNVASRKQESEEERYRQSAAGSSL
jgi:hypothetical protein